jgi:hypothetical protein
MPMPLANPEATSDLIRWDVPFALGRLPSVRVITQSPGSDVTLIVAPNGLGEYPQFLVRFGHVFILFCYDEAGGIDRDWESLVRSEYDLSAYRWITSPWVNQNRGLEDSMLWKPEEKLHHYILLGGDTIAEVVALGEPQIERVDQKMTIEVKYEV